MLLPEFRRLVLVADVLDSYDIGVRFLQYWCRYSYLAPNRYSSKPPATDVDAATAALLAKRSDVHFFRFYRGRFH